MLNHLCAATRSTGDAGAGRIVHAEREAIFRVHGLDGARRRNLDVSHFGSPFFPASAPPPRYPMRVPVIACAEKFLSETAATIGDKV